MRTNNEITIRLTAREIRNADVDRLRFLFDMQRGTFHGLDKLCGTVRPLFPDAGIPIFEDPDARRFCAALYDVFPTWMLFINLSDATLWKMTLCVLESMQIVESAKKRRISVDPVEANVFVAGQIRNCVRTITHTRLNPKSFEPQMQRASRYYGRFIRSFSRHKR